jgi:hypothetical protein
MYPSPHVGDVTGATVWEEIAGRARLPHGQLSVRGSQLTGSSGEPVSLAGVSLFWSQWMPQFYTAECVRFFADSFGATLVRAALGVQSELGLTGGPTSGYLCDRREAEKVFRVADAAIQCGIYVILDFHSHHAHTQVDAACAFFSTAAQRYAGYENVIYEIYNERALLLLDPSTASPVLNPSALRLVAPSRSRYARPSRRLLAAGRWLLAAGCWLLAAGR